MSEFSESYHLRSERSEDACDLLRQVGMEGYVYPPSAGWVTFVVEGGSFEPDPLIVAAARQPLLYYVSAEDHCWSFDLFDRGEVVCAYRCDWCDGVTFDDSLYSRAALQRFIPSAQAATLDSLEQRLHPADFDEVLEAEPSKLFARAIGLEYYEWVAYDYIALDFHESLDKLRHVTKIP